MPSYSIMQQSDVTGNHHTALQALSQVSAALIAVWAKAIKRRQLAATSPTLLSGGETRLVGDIASFAACAEVLKKTVYMKFGSNEM
jgi:hypothetical protein